jgi:C_GCAxxG_C_C family probable redox protein
LNKDAASKSREYFNSGFWCAESVLQAISEEIGIHSELIPKIATGFCSGMARTGGQCGAVSGAIMGMSLVCGRSTKGAPVDAIYSKVRRLREKFEDQFGNLNSGDLLGVDLSTPEGQSAFRDRNLMEKCLEYTEEATRMAMLLLEEKEPI